MKTFKINELITLQLEGNETNIYVNGNLFNQCKYVLMNIPKKVEIYERDYVNIDELKVKYSNENESDKELISPETEFMVHCSNLQTWIENDYNPAILHSNLSVPLLKKLIEYDKRVFFRLLYHLDTYWIEYESEYDSRFTLQRRRVLMEQYKELVEKCIEQYEISEYEQSLSVFIMSMKIIDMLRKMYGSMNYYCEVCEKYHYNLEFCVIELFNVDDDIPNESVNVCQDCLDDGYPHESEIAEYCDTCNRYIYTSYYSANIVYIEEWSEIVCSKCFNSIVLDEGLPEFRAYKYLDELSNEQLESNGFKFFSQFKVLGNDEWKRFENLFDSLKDSGKSVMFRVEHGTYQSYTQQRTEFSVWIKK